MLQQRIKKQLAVLYCDDVQGKERQYLFLQSMPSRCFESPGQWPTAGLHHNNVPSLCYHNENKTLVYFFKIRFKSRIHFENKASRNV